MVEVKNGISSVATMFSQSEVETPGRFETFTERRREEKDQSDDLDQLATIVLASLPPMPVLTLHAQEERSGPAVLHEERKMGASRFDEGVQKPELRQSGVMRTGSESAMSAKRDGTEGKTQVLPLASESRIRMPQSEMNTLASAVSATSMRSLRRGSRNPQEDVMNDGAIRLSFSGTHFGEKKTAKVLHKPAPFEVDCKLQTAPDQSGAQNGLPADGWTFNFRSWGAQHAVKIASHAGKPEADAPFSLLPSSNLVEQRLQLHAKDQGDWILNEHRDNQQEDRPRQHRDDAEEDER